VSNTIDNRVVEMRFDNKQFETAVSTTIQSMSKLTEALKLEAAAKGFAGITQAATKVNISAISAGVRDVNWSLVALKTAAETVFRNMTNGAIEFGKKMQGAMGIDGMKAGFSEYELKMNATQTMMASTGESLEVVNKHLQALNDYSDQTIYSFSDMTQNIGKFTNAGVKLPIAVNAIKGIANSAALSGANADEAAQAISKGSVALIDWKSIELANMGTQEFKQQLIDTAVKAGTLKKAGKGMYQVLTENGQGKVMKGTISAAKNFNESLAYQWMTTKVLTGTLNNYADITTDIGRRATKAATNIKTFSQMVGVVKEAIGSGWSQSFEKIFGNFEEAKALWTDVALKIGSVIGPLADARNEALEFWKVNGGRQAVINGLTNIFNSLGAVFKVVRDLYVQIFPPKTGQDMVKLSIAFENFTKKLTPSAKVLENIGYVFRTLFIAVKLLKIGFGVAVGVIKAFFTGLFGTSSQLTEFGTTVLGAVKSFADYVKGMLEAVNSTGDFGKNVSALKETFKGLGEVIGGFMVTVIGWSTEAWNAISTFFNEVKAKGQGVSQFFKDLGTAIKELFSGDNTNSMDGWGEKIGKAFSNIDWKKVVVGMFAAMSAIMAWGLYKTVKKVAGAFTGIIDLLKKPINALTGVLGEMQNSLKAKSIRNIAIAIGILAVSLYILSKVDPNTLFASTMALSFLVAAMMEVLANLGDIKPEAIKSVIVASAAMVVLGVAVMLLAGSVAILGNMDPKAFWQGMGAVAALLAGILVFAKIASGADLSMLAAGLLAVAVAMNLLIAPVVILGKMDPEALNQGLVALARLLLGLIVFTKVTNGADLSQTAAAIVGVGIALLLMSAAIKVIATMKPEEVKLAMMTIGGLLVGIAIFANSTDSLDLAGTAVAIIALGAALLLIAVALKIVGSIPMDQLIVGGIALAAIFVLLGAMVVFLSKADPTGAGAAGLLMMSISLTAIALALALVGALPLSAILKGVLGFALILGILALATAGLMIPGAALAFMALAFGLLMIANAVLLAGLGMMAFATGIMYLAAALSTGGAVILEFIMQLLDMLPMMAIKLGIAMTAFFMAMTSTLPAFFVFLSALIVGLLAVFILAIPKFVLVIFTLIMTILTAIDTYLPQIMAKIVSIIVGILNELTKAVPKLAQAGADLIIALIRGIGEQSIRITDAAAETLIKFLDGLTNSVIKYADKIDKSTKNLVNAVGASILKALGLYEFWKLGEKMVDGLKAGLIAAADKFGGPAAAVVRAAFNATKKESKIESPSKLFMQIGRWWALGMAEGLVNNVAGVTTAAKTVVSSAYSAMATAGNQAVDIFNGIVDPTITPVVNLDNVYAGAKTIASLMTDASAIDAASSVNARLSTNNYGSNAATDVSGNRTDVSLTQNNYSPKALSRLEIYRQTQNQLRQLKGLGG
jgi:hypothetical protein